METYESLNNEEVSKTEKFEREKLPFIEFKDHVEEDKEEHRFVVFFSLILAIIGAIIVVAIPRELLFPNLVQIGDLDISSNLPLLQSVAGAVIGAFSGAVIGFILDLFINAYHFGKNEKKKE